MMKIDRRGLIAGLLAALMLLLSPAYAQTPRRVILSGGVPSWVKSGAAADLDFANGRYFGCTLSSCLSITRASQKTNLLPSSASGFAYTTFANNTLAITTGLGLLIEESRTNQLLNSAVPATQTTGSLGTATYTLWVNGSGSATMSAGTGTGCGTGVASQGTPVNFTITVAGTCTVTVSGSLNAFQLEAGAFGTSFIVTTGAAGTRNADNILAAGLLLSTLQGAQGTEYVAANLEGVTAGAGVPLIEGDNSNTFGMRSNNLSGANGGSFLRNVTNLCVASGGFSVGANQKMIGSWKQSNYALSLNGAAVVTSSNAAALNNAGAFRIGYDNVLSLNGYVREIAIWSAQLPNASLPGM